MEYGYDGEHHPVSSTVYPAPGQSITTGTGYYPNGLVSRVTDGRGVPTFFTRDQYGNPRTSRINGQKEIRYQYDAPGRLQQLTDQENNTTKFQYNDRGLVIRKTDPWGRITSYSYNNDGTIHSRTDRNGDTTSYTYTPTGKVDTVSYADGTSVHFTYDQHDRLSAMTDSLGATTYQRDAAGRVTSMTDANGNTVGYTYDENGYTGLLTTLTYPGGNQVHYTYDELNRLKTVTNWLGQTATYVYDDAGRLLSFTNFNGAITTYSLDNADRLTGINTTTSGNAVVAAFSYTLDGSGNRVSIDRTVPNAGTLPTRNETADYTHNRLMSTDTAMYGYDSEGQLSSKQEGSTVSYSFDKAYRLTGIGANTQFSYDGAGNRLRAIRAGVETRYIYDASGNLLAEADASNTITRYYVHGAGLLAAITPADAVYCYHFDATGNTVAITDGSQAVVNSYDYSPFGMILSETEAFAQPFKYVGKLGVMSEEDFYYMRARYYDPVTGRFISEDPKGFDGGDVNLYVYAGNNPVLLVDPWGLFDLQASTRNFINRIGGEQMLANTRDASLIVAGAAALSGLPAAGFVATAGIAEGLRTSLYSGHPYREVIQTTVTTAIGVKNPGFNMIVSEGVNQANRYEDSFLQGQTSIAIHQNIYKLCDIKVKIFPAIHNRRCIDFADTLKYTFFKFFFAGHPYMPQEGTSHF